MTIRHLDPDTLHNDRPGWAAYWHARAVERQARARIERCIEQGSNDAAAEAGLDDVEGR